MIDGTLQWNNVSTVSFNWVRQTPDFSNYNPTPSPCASIQADVNGVHYRPVANFVAFTYTCSSGSFLLHAQVVFGSGQSWYSGTGTPPMNQVDAWAFSAHEFGHATGGWLDNSIGGHFGGATLCPENSSKHTMCAIISGGTTWQRSLAFHDSETFDNAY